MSKDNKVLAKSELLCVASASIEKFEDEDLGDYLEDDEPNACGAMSKEDLDLLIKENTIETTRLS